MKRQDVLHTKIEDLNMSRYVSTRGLSSREDDMNSGYDIR